jgi:hypothetical protein
VQAVRSSANEAFLRRCLGIARTLFVSICVLDVALLGSILLKCVTYGLSKTAADIALTGETGVVGFAIGFLFLAASPLLLWWVQAWLESRAIAVAITDSFVNPVRSALAEADTSARFLEQRQAFEKTLRHDVDSWLSRRVAYRPMMNLRASHRPGHLSQVERIRGQYDVAIAVARTMVQTRLNEELHRLQFEDELRDKVRERAQLTDGQANHVFAGS